MSQEWKITQPLTLILKRKLKNWCVIYRELIQTTCLPVLNTLSTITLKQIQTQFHQASLPQLLQLQFPVQWSLMLWQRRIWTQLRTSGSHWMNAWHIQLHLALITTTCGHPATKRAMGMQVQLSHQKCAKTIKNAEKIQFNLPSIVHSQTLRHMAKSLEWQKTGTWYMAPTIKMVNSGVAMTMISATEPSLTVTMFIFQPLLSHTFWGALGPLPNRNTLLHARTNLVQKIALALVQ